VVQVDLDLPSLITREGPAPFQPLLSRWILGSPSNHQRGPLPLPTPSCPGGSWTPPLITRGGSAPFQPLPAQVDLDLPLITRGGPAPFQPLPAQRILASPSNHQKTRPLPSPYIPGLAIGESVYREALNKDGSGVDHSQSSTLDNVCKLLLSHFRKLYLKCCQIIGCLVLITIVF
jgi:hypothetical protein